MPRETRTQDAVIHHVQQHFGPIASVWHELTSPHANIDVHIVRPTPARPCLTLVTSGMSERPMAVPDGAGDNPFCELTLSLPPDWPVGDDAFKDDRAYWPVRLLKRVASLPHTQNTWIAASHSVPNGDPAQPYAPGSPFVAALVSPLLRCAPAAGTVPTADGREISLLALVPLHAAELDLSRSEGASALAKAFEYAGVTELLDPHRPSIV